MIGEVILKLLTQGYKNIYGIKLKDGEKYSHLSTLTTWKF